MIASLTAAIKTIGAAASGIKSGFDPAPNDLNSSSLPALWCFTGPAREDQSQFSDYASVVRTMRVQVAVLPTAQGTPAEREKKCRPLLDAVTAQLRSYPHLGVDWVQKAQVAGDSGIVILPEYAGKYIGFEIQLEVAYYVKRTYAAGE
jgi:hypothetical protein